MLAAFWLFALAVLAAPLATLVAVRRRRELDSKWYGLAGLGGVALVLSYLARDILVRPYLLALGADAPETRAELFSPWHALVFFPLAGGVIVEVLKTYGVTLFSGSFTRSEWPVYAVAIGLGAGFLEAAIGLGSTAMTALGGNTELGADQFWLCLRYLFLIPFHAATAALAMYWIASGKRWLGWLLAGGLHALVLFALQLLQFRMGVEAPWLGAAAFAVGLAMAAGAVWGFNKRLGWPM